MRDLKRDDNLEIWETAPEHARCSDRLDLT